MPSSLDNLRKSAKRWLKALRAGEPEARQRYARAYPDGPSEPGLRDVQHALARERGHQSWIALTHAAATEPDAPVAVLLEAAGKGDVVRVAAILDEHPGIINERGTLPGNSGLRTALHFGSGHADVVRLLLERGADPNIRDEGDNAYPIHFAAERGDVVIVTLLVEHGADPDGAGTTHELNAPGWAVCFDYVNHVDVARYLLAHGAKHDLFTATALGDADAIRRLVAEGADLNRRMDGTNHRRTALHLAAIKKQPGALVALLEAGADPNIEDAAGLTPLDQAALIGETAMAERLLAYGAELRLAAAITMGRTEDLERLLRERPELMNQELRTWARIIVSAAARAPRDVLETLLRTAERHRGGLSIVNLADDTDTAVDGARGYTALHAAAFAGNDEAVEVLLAHGANPRARDGKYCSTPAGWARYAGHDETAERILASDIDIFDAINFDRADRVTAILDRDPGALDRPFKACADCPAKEGQRWPRPDMTPVEWAVSQGKQKAAQVLTERGAGRTPEQVAHAERVTRFLQFSCWDHHVHGKGDHRMYDRAAQRILQQHPEIASDSLYTAVVCGELDEVRRIVSERPEAAREPGGPRGWTPILYSTFTRFTLPRTIANGVAIARVLLEHGANPNDFYMAGDARYTALVGAAGEGEQDSPRQPYAAELFQLLLEHGAEPFDIQVLYNTHFSGDVLWWLELVYEHSMTTGAGGVWRDPEWPMLDMGGRGSGARFLIHLALEKRDMRLLEWVLVRGANPNAATARAGKWRRWTPYEEAVWLGWPEAAEVLARHGARRSAPKLSGDEQFLAACMAMDRARVTAMVEREPQRLDHPAALFEAARRNRADVVAMVLDLGTSPDITGEGGQRPLHAAAAHNAVDAARVLIGRGADVDAEEPVYHSTPIGWAAHGDRQEMLDFLSTVSHDPWRLAFRGYVDRLRLVIGARPELATSVDREGHTLLWWLPDDEDKALEIVELLLAHGADPAAKNTNGRTAADWAATRGMTRVEQRLRTAATDRPPKGQLPAKTELPAKAGSHASASGNFRLQPEAIERYERLARDLVVAYETGQPEALRRLGAHFGRALAQEDVRAAVWQRVPAVRYGGGAAHYFDIDDARDLLAREAGHGGWTAFVDALSGRPSRPIRPAYFIDRERKAIRPGRRLTDADWDDLIAAADDHGLTTLEAGGQLTDELLGRVAALTRLTRIEFNGTGQITDDGLRHLARMPQLEEIDLSQYPGGRITDRGLEVLRQLPALRRFDMMWQANITDAGLAHLAACDRLENVNVLGTATGDGAIRALEGKQQLTRLLTGRRVTDAGLARLPAVPRFAASGGVDVHLGIEGPFTNDGLRVLGRLDGISRLNIGGTSSNVTSVGLTTLAGMVNLRDLSYDGEICDDAAMREIARIPRLRNLSCQDTVAGDEGFTALSESPTIESIWGRRCHNLRGRGFAALSRMPALRKLGVSCRNVDDAALARLPQFPALRVLTPIDVTDEGFRHVGRCERLEDLTCMYCRDTTDAATEHIAGLRQLRKYYAGHTRITDRSLEILSGMGSLEIIQLWNCAGVTDAGIARLARLPRLREIALHDCALLTPRSAEVFSANVKVDFA